MDDVIIANIKFDPNGSFDFDSRYFQYNIELNIEHFISIFPIIYLSTFYTYLLPYIGFSLIYRAKVNELIQSIPEEYQDFMEIFLFGQQFSIYTEKLFELIKNRRNNRERILASSPSKSALPDMN